MEILDKPKTKTWIQSEESYFPSKQVEYLPSTKKDIESLANEIREAEKRIHIRLEEFERQKSGTKILHIRKDNLKASKGEKIRQLILFFTSIASGIGITLIMQSLITNSIYALFYFSFTISAIGAAIASLIALRKGKHYDERK